MGVVFVCVLCLFVCCCVCLGVVVFVWVLFSSLLLPSFSSSLSSPPLSLLLLSLFSSFSSSLSSPPSPPSLSSPPSPPSPPLSLRLLLLLSSSSSSSPPPPPHLRPLLSSPPPPPPPLVLSSYGGTIVSTYRDYPRHTVTTHRREGAERMSRVRSKEPSSMSRAPTRGRDREPLRLGDVWRCIPAPRRAVVAS